MTTVPNELKININTSIPGYQKITYSPNMTDPSIEKKETGVLFNPLIKLTKSLIDSIPESIRIKEFFIPGLFSSLGYHHGVQKAINLQQAKEKGYIDNNIQITLDTLFPPNSVIYISGQPYVIVDIQWTKGDWKIDTKQKLVDFDTNQNSDPFIYAEIIREDIKTGEKQMETLPDDLIYGPNFNGLKNTKMSTVIEPTLTETTKTINQAENHSQPNTMITNDQTQQKQNKINPLQITNGPLQSQNTNTNTYPQITQQDITDLGNLEPSAEQVLKTDNKKTDFLKSYFSSKDFYNMTDAIFINSDKNTKEIIRQLLRKISVVDVQQGNHLSRAAYDATVNGLSVRENRGGGDCYFIAVADAINYYNYENQSSRIIYNNYGIGNKLFTQSYLRTLVYQYINNEYVKKNKLDNLLTIGQQNANTLNDDFENRIQDIEREGGNITPDLYLDILQEFYRNHENFFVEKPNNVPINLDKYYRPYEVVKQSGIKNYIEGPYWADELATIALANILNLNVITIEKTPDNYMRCSYGMFETTVENNWNKYLFLYYDIANNHYELITFKYIRIIPKNVNSTRKINRRSVTQQTTTISIFERKNSIIVPPLYILLLIYINVYINIPDVSNFSFLPDIIYTINVSFKSIVRKAVQNNDQQAIKTIGLFYKYFPTSRSLQRIEHDIVSSNPRNLSLITNTNTNKQPSEQSIVPVRSSTRIMNQNKTQSSNQNTELNKQQGGINSFYDNPYSNYQQPVYAEAQPVYQPPNYQYPNYQYPGTNYQYPNYYRRQLSNFNNPYLATQQIKSSDNSNIAYYITIDMELHPGTSLSPEELSHTKCIQRKNAIKKSFSNLTGTPYVIDPVYKFYPNKNKNKNKTVKNTSPQNQTNQPFYPNYPNYPNNYTRRANYYNYQ